MDVITTHTNADFDCLGAMVAAARLYPDALLSFPGSQEKGVRDFLERHPDYFPANTRAKDIDLSLVTRLIIVDCQHQNRIGRFGEIIGTPGLDIHIYDHHPETASSIRQNGGIVRPCGSSSAILAGVMMDHGMIMTPEEATLVMLGIYEDTGRLLFSSTTRDDFLAASWLLGQGAKLDIVSSFLSQGLNVRQLELLNILLKTLKSSVINGVKVSIAHASSDEYIGDIAALSHIMRDMENLDSLFMVVAMESRVYLVARSRVPEVNAGDILRHFNGGGHATAASAVVRDQTLKQVLQRLEELLRIVVSPNVYARDIMSSPVKIMPAGIAINEARELLTRYNCNAMPILDEGKMVGIISRKTVEKALYHSLGSSLVDDFMQTEFMRGTPATLLTDIQEYMVKGNRRFVPVFEEGQLVGAVTRTDLLRQMYGGRHEEPGTLYDIDALGNTPKSRSITGLIGKRLPAEAIRLLHSLGKTGDELGLSVYAVGGFVRDLLLGVNNLDMDITVEGDGIFFAEHFATLHGCRVRSHHKFGTAVVIFPQGMKIDVASTRLEYYESPGVLPTVERSSLRHDLYRRDFTINTLAFSLNSDSFGRLTDYFGAQQDLQDKYIRVLHNLSFVEDPTRVFRAIRFEQRLDFRIAPHTENLIRSAVRMNLVNLVGSRRLFNELLLILEEQEPAGAIARIAALGLLPFIHSGLKLTPDTERVIHETAKVLAWFRLLYLEDPCQQWQLYFLALCDTIKADGFKDACRRLEMPGRTIKRLTEGRRRVYSILESIHRRLKRGPEILRSEIYHLFQGLPLEMLLYLAAKGVRDEVRRFVSLYLTQLRQVKCALNGEELKSLGLSSGPKFRSVMDRLLVARLDGEISNDFEERALAAELIISQNDSAMVIATEKMISTKDGKIPQCREHYSLSINRATVSSPRIALISPYSDPPMRGNIATVQRIIRSLGAAGATILNLAADSLSLDEMALQLAEFKPDLIHSFHAHYGGRLARQLAEQSHIPYVITITGTDINEPLLRNHHDTGRAIKGAKAVVCFSSIDSKLLAEYFPKFEGEVAVVPQGVETLPNVKGENFGLANDAFVLLLPAALRPVKQIEFPLLALAVLAQADSTLRLVIAGGVIDQDYATTIKGMLTKAPFASWLGDIPREQMGSLYCRADLVLNCSCSESMCNSIMEAMALGRPVLAADISGNRSLVRHGENGWLYNGEEEFRSLVLKLRGDVQLRKKVGSNAREEILANFSPQLEAERYLELYRRLV